MKLLESHNYKSDRWIGSDTEELFNINLSTQPEGWPWRKQPVTYTINSQRYRAPEWDQIDWGNSIVVFGCSQVFGIGVDDHQTACHQLSCLLGINVVNLGMPGGSCMGQWINTEKLLNYKVKPLAVIYNWPMANRIIELVDDTKNHSAGPWMLDHKPERFSKDWVTHPTQGFEYAKYAYMSVKRSWQCQQLHYSWDKDLSAYLNLPRLLKVDQARDCMHDGPLTLKNWAAAWAAELKL